MNIKSKNLAPAILGGLILSALLTPTIKIYATTSPNYEYSSDGSSYFDLNAQACVIENYNSENETSITSISDVKFDKITEIACSNRGITNFRGVTLMTNLEKLDLSYNENVQLWNLNLENNRKLKEIDIRGVSSTSLDISNNPNLEVLKYDYSSSYGAHILYLTTSAYAESTNGKTIMDLSKLKFVPADAEVSVGSVYTYDSASKIVTYKNDRSNIIGVTLSFNGGVYNIIPRTGYMSTRVFLNGDEEVETHNPLYLYNNCEEKTYDSSNGTKESYYTCNDTVLYGDALDTDAIYIDTLKKIFNLDNYKLSEVKIVPPTANLELTKNETTLKQGTILADANFTLEFYFDLKTEEESDSDSSDAKTPNTGFFTSEDGSVNASNVLLSLAGISISTFAVIYIGTRFAKKSKAKRF